MKPQLIVCIFFLLFSCAHKSHPSKQNRYSIIQGLTSAHSVEFSVVTKPDENHQFELISPDGHIFTPSEVKWVHQPFGISFHIAKIYFKDLPSAEYFDFKVKRAQVLVDKRKIHLFENKGEKLRFAVASCLNQNFSDIDEIWESLLTSKPEIIFLVGDNTYSPSAADGATPNLLAQSYLDSRNSIPLYFWDELVPVHAVWDDNDFGMNDGNKSYQYKNEAKEIFSSFFAQSFPSETADFGEGISSRLHLRGMHFAFLDNRSFRDVNGAGDHFGEGQENWLFNTIQTSELPTWIFSGDQFFGGYHTYESYEGNHPEKFNIFKERLQKTTTPFILLSGDRHMSEVMQFPRSILGQLSFEITSSPMHSKIYPGQLEKVDNPWRVFGIDSEFNFLLVDTELKDQSWDINLSFVGKKNLVLAKRDLSLTTEPLKDFTIDKKIRRRKYRRSRTRRR